AGLMLAISGLAHAQVTVSLNLNITPPEWGPAEATNVKYYFIPDIQVYYDVVNKVFIYQSNGVWVRATSLPGMYATFDLNSGYKVMLTDADGDKPYEHFDDHCRKFPKGYNHGQAQKTWAQAHGRGHHKDDGDGDEHHDNGVRNHGHGNGHGNGNHKHDGDDNQ